MSGVRRLVLALSALSAVLVLSALRLPAHAQTETEFVANLRGNQEVPPVITGTTGRATITFNSAFTKGTFQLTVNGGKRITQAHIHCNVVGMNGPIFIFLAGFHDRGWNVDGQWVDNATFTDENIIEPSCGTNLRQVARSIENGRAYVNAHSVEHPAGEVRGQLTPAP